MNRRVATARSRTARNYCVALATAAVTGLAFLYPTSTGRSTVSGSSAVTVASAGVVAGSTGSATVSPTSGGQSVTPVTPLTPTTPTTPVTVNGPAVDTRFGPVQVQISVLAGRVVSATAIVYPQTNGRDQEINSRAIPVLQQETVSAQSAQIDTVSGATYTSDGYRTSLQAALDSAHVG